MDGKDLGKIIRGIRLEKKMTQSEVVGSFITRNMLSKIESGSAVPSLPTLNYLAKALEVPLSRLLPDEQTKREEPLALLTQAKEALHKHQYEAAIGLANQLPPSLLDESEAISAKAYLFLAKENLARKEFDQVTKNTSLALNKAKKGLYASRDVQTEALLTLEASQEEMKQKKS